MLNGVLTIYKESGYTSHDVVAKMRGILFGQVLFTADSLADVDAYDTRNFGNDFFAAAMKIAMEAITQVQS